MQLRINIARALLLDPRILILDEAFDYIESEKEYLIFNSIIKAHPRIIE